MVSLFCHSPGRRPANCRRTPLCAWQGHRARSRPHSEEGVRLNVGGLARNTRCHQHSHRKSAHQCRPRRPPLRPRAPPRLGSHQHEPVVAWPSSHRVIEDDTFRRRRSIAPQRSLASDRPVGGSGSPWRYDHAHHRRRRHRAGPRQLRSSDGRAEQRPRPPAATPRRHPGGSPARVNDPRCGSEADPVVGDERADAGSGISPEVIVNRRMVALRRYSRDP